MSDEPMTATSSVLPVPPTSEMETSQPEDVIKANDVPEQETVSSADGNAKAAAGKEAVSTTNGEPKSVDPPQATAAPTQITEDADMKDADEPSAPAQVTSAADSASVPANGTPVSSKKVNSGGSSKKKAAVPEHKSKKLSKKKSRPMTNLDAQPGEYYFARMKGHPPWPSVICDEEMLPNSLLTSRPVTARQPDRTFRKPEYEDGGKRAHERTFPIMFLHTNEFAWIPNTELTPLDPEDETIKQPIEKGKSKLLLSAYAKAAEGNDLSYFKTMLVEHQKALQEDMAEKEERAAELKAKKAKKFSRKSSDAAALADDDEMDVDDVAAEKPKSKKRKKTDDSEVEEKPAKTPKTSTKLKLSEPKTPASEVSTKKKKPASKLKAKATKSSSDDDDSTSKVEEKILSAEEQMQVKERKVLYYRHKLQRGLLSRDSVPKEDEMKPMSDFLAELETFPDLEGSIIRATKIHKVLKQIIKLGSIPMEEHLRFKDRSRELLAKWNETLNNDPAGAGEKDDEKADDPKTPALPATNGDAAVATKETEKEEKAEAPAEPAAKPPTKLENKIGTTVEGAKEADHPRADAKAQEKAENAEEKADDGPAVQTAPAAEFKPAPAAETATEPTA